MEQISKKERKLNISQYFNGLEPKPEEYGKLSIHQILNWYASNITQIEQKEYTLSYIKNNLQLDKKILSKLESLDECWFLNLGSKCRMVERKYPFNEDQINHINEIINGLIERVSIEILQDETKIKKDVVQRFDASEYLAFIDDRVWDFLHEKNYQFDFYKYYISNNVNFVYCKRIIEKYTKLLDELILVFNGDDELKEYYSNLTKPQLKKYIEFIKAIINDAEKIRDNAKKTRKQRTPKKIDSNKQIKDLKYCKSNSTFKITSIDPLTLIGAKILIVFDCQYRKLGIYYSNNENGFSVKGTTIQNFDENSSITKIIRKPEDILNKIQNVTKNQVKVLLKDIKTTENKLTGRINSDIILLKAFK